jgi:mercuric ion binding protein
MPCHISTDQEFIMNTLKLLFSSLTLAFAVAPASAAIQTVTLSVPGMTCPACPFTVKKALSRVDGVSKVEIAYEQREASVTFDDAKTDVEGLTKASKDAGYPATVKE